MADAVGRAVECDLHGGHPAGLPGPHPHEGTVACQDDRVAGHVPDRAPREQQVRELVEGRPPARHHVQLRVVEQRPVLGLDQDAAVDPVQVQVG